MRLPKAQATVEEFIQGASRPVVSDTSPTSDPLKNVALRLPESYAAKLQWISEQTDIPQQKLLRKWLIPIIDAEAEKLK